MPVTVTAGAQVPGQLHAASQGIPQGVSQASRGTPHSWPLQVCMLGSGWNVWADVGMSSVSAWLSIVLSLKIT